MNIYKAYTVAEAYAQIEQRSLDLILLDVMLPDGSGYDVCRHLKGFSAVSKYSGDYFDSTER